MVDVKSKEYISANLLDLAPKIIKVAKRGPWAHQKPLNFWQSGDNEDDQELSAGNKKTCLFWLQLCYTNVQSWCKPARVFIFNPFPLKDFSWCWALVKRFQHLDATTCKCHQLYFWGWHAFLDYSLLIFYSCC